MVIRVRDERGTLEDRIATLEEQVHILEEKVYVLETKAVAFRGMLDMRDEWWKDRQAEFLKFVHRVENLERDQVRLSSDLYRNHREEFERLEQVK